MDSLQKVSYLPLTLTLAASMATMSFQTVISPVMDLIAVANGLSNFQTALLAAIVSLPNFLLTLPSGYILDRFNPIKLSLFNFILICLACFCLFFSRAYPTILFFRFIGGLTFAPLIIMGTQLPILIYPKQLHNRMVTIQTLGAPLATILAFYLGAFIGTHLGYTYVYIIPLILALTGVVISLKLWSTKVEREVRKKEHNRLSRQTYIMMIIWFIFMFTTSIFLIQGTSIGLELGLTRTVAVFGASMLMIPALIVSPIVGEVMDKRFSRLKLFVFASIVMAVSLALIPIGKTYWVVGAILLGLSSAIIPPIVFSSPSKFESSRTIARALATFNFFGTMGILISPPVAGWLRDKTGTWTAPFIIATALCLLITFISYEMRRDLK